jgi:xanthine dehydrogenase accessory factor
MDSMDLDVLRQAVRWLAEPDVRVVLGTVTRTWGSAPRPVGALVAVRVGADSRTKIAGSVSGGCIEDDLVAQIRAGALALSAPQVTRYGLGAEAARQVGLPCGGLLELVLEPLGAESQLDALLAALERGERVQRTLELASGAVTLAAAPPPGDLLRLTETTLTTTHGPRWRLLIIGAGQLTRYLVPLARSLDYAVTVCDPREEHGQEIPTPGVTTTREMPDDVVVSMRADAHTAIVALTHDPKLDDLALMEALKSEAFYVGAIGSRLNQAKRRARLAEHFGLTEAELARLHGPVGLAIGARTPPEIALAIAGEMTAVRYGLAR